MKRRRFLQVALGACAGGGAYALGAAPNPIVVERMDVVVDAKCAGLHGLKVVALSDFHLYPFTNLAFLKEAFAIARSLKPDMVVLLGDFVDSSVDAIDELAPALATIDARLGLYAILGNHDCRKGPEIVQAGLSKAGIEVLRNRGVSLQHGGSEIWLGGVDSFWGEPDLDKVLSMRPSGAASVLLAHEPDIADRVASAGVHIQLSGHSHGGQVNVPGLVHGVLPRMGRKYAFGSYRVGDMFLHTTRGLGMTGVPVRFRSDPEVTEITLVCR